MDARLDPDDRAEGEVLSRVLVSVRCACGVYYPMVAIRRNEDRICFTRGRPFDEPRPAREIR